MTATPSASLVATSRFGLVAAVAGSIALSFAGVAAADSGTIDQPVGGNQCGGQPSKCAGVSLPFTQPPEASQVEVTFDKNPNPCADFGVQVNADGVTQIPLGTQVPLPPGNHTLNVNPTCSTDLTSWGGTVHISKIAVTGKPAAPAAPAAQTTPSNAIEVRILQSPTKVEVSVQNTAPNDAGICTYDAHPVHDFLLPPVHEDFTVGPQGMGNNPHILDFPSPPLGTTYHLVVNCKSQLNDQPLGHFEQDVTGSLS